MPSSRSPRSSRRDGARLLDVPRVAQPNDVTCGPTCLAQVYRSHGDDMPLDSIRRSVRRNRDGGTLAVYLAIAARGHGYAVTLTSWNWRIFDPTWSRLGIGALRAKLTARARRVPDPKLRRACQAYVELLTLGGTLRFGIDLAPSVLMAPIDRGHPLVVGVSATHLYRTTRERPRDNSDDDVGGSPTGHFVVLAGYRNQGRTFDVRDPQGDDGLGADGRYRLGYERLASAMLLGDATYDAVMLELAPPRRGSRP